MAFQNIGFIGLGLIGGSIALRLKKTNPGLHLIATAGRESTIQTAHGMGLIDNDTLLPLSAFAECDYIFLCAPTQMNLQYLSQLKDLISPWTVITDVGSTKTEIHEEANRLGLERQFIGGHPMAGTEKAGIENASPVLLENAYYIITPTEHTPYRVITEFYEIVRSTGALPLQLDYREHDRAVAAISHLPHMISFTLTNMVQAIDDPKETMKTVSAGSFRDMTRVSASSPVMWENICMSNRAPILELMDIYLQRFSELRDLIAESDTRGLLDYFGSAKEYRDSLSVPGSRIRRQFFELYVDLADEAGGIAIIASLLAFQGISLKNIGIINNREFSDGVLRIEFYDQKSMDLAQRVLKERNYTIHIR